MTGVLFAYMHPTPEDQASFDEWYELEHVTGRAAIPGFRRALMFQSSPPAARITVYELDDPAVLRSSLYLALRAETNDATVERLDRLTEFVRIAGEAHLPDGFDDDPWRRGLAVAVRAAAHEPAEVVRSTTVSSAEARGLTRPWVVDADPAGTNVDATHLLLVPLLDGDAEDERWQGWLTLLQGDNLEVMWHAVLPWRAQLFGPTGA